MSREGKRKALIIGISYYTDTRLDELDFCKNDGEKMYELLESLRYEISENNNLIGKVEGEKVKDAIYDFFGANTTHPDDTLLFYFSGHGVPDVDGDTYLASSDINPDEPGRRGFSFGELTKMIHRSISTRKVVILDCCYSGAAKLSSKGMGTSKGDEDNAAKLGRVAIDEALRKLPQGQGTYILSSSLSLQQSYVLTTGEHSFYTYYLLEGLKGNTESVDSEGNVTPQSLGKYVYRKIMSLPADKRPKQTPITRAEESGNVILAYYPELITSKIEDTLKSMLNLLREDKVQEFNRMREQNPAVSLDFARENLHGVHIAGANLSSTYLKRVNLSEADLEGADLSNANLFRADLEGADLHKANLSKAVLEAANLSNANLTKANLSNANLTKANLSYANSYSADLQQAILIGADLRGTNLTDANLVGADLRGSIFDEKKPMDTDSTTTTKPDTKKNIDSVAIDSDKSSGAPIVDVSRPSIQEPISPSPHDEERKKYYRLWMPILGAAVVGVIVLVLVITTPWPPTPSITTPPVSNDTYALVNKGIALEHLGNYTQAIQYYDNALAIDPNYVAALANKGDALYYLGNYTQAIQYYDKVLPIDPNDKYTLANKGGALYFLGNYTQAIQYSDKALAIDPNYVAALVNKGDSLSNLGNHTQAIQVYDKALAINPRDNYTLDRLAADLETSGNWTGAIKYANKALVMNPNDTYASTTKTLALNGLKQPSITTKLPNQSKQITTINETTATKFLKYENSTYGIKMQYPSVWHVESIRNSTVVAMFFPQGNNANNVTVDMSIENLSTSLTPDEYLKNVMRSDLANYRAFPDIKFTINTTSNVVLAGHPGFLLVGTFKDPASGVLDGFSNIGTIIGSKAYSIQYYSPEQTYPVYSTIYNKMIKSFEVINTSSGQNNTSPKNQSTSNTLSTYENSTYGVRVKYPSDWTVSGTNVSSAVSDSSFATFYSPSTSNFSSSYTVATISLGTETLANLTTNLNNYAHHIALDSYANSGKLSKF